jgi:hypothetical protein
VPSSNPSGSMPPSEQPSDQPSLSGAPSSQPSLSPSQSSAPSEEPSLQPSESLKPSVSAEPSESSQPSVSNQPSNSLTEATFCIPRANEVPTDFVACNSETQLQLASAGSCIGTRSCFDNEGEIGIDSCTGEEPASGTVSACESNIGDIGDGSW